MEANLSKMGTPTGFCWGVYEKYAWDRRRPNVSNISVSGLRLREYRLDDIANQEALLADFSRILNTQDALSFMHKWGWLVPEPKMRVVLAAAASVRWLLTVISELHASAYDRILSWVDAEEEPDKSYGDVVQWLNTAAGRDWMRKTRCKYFPRYFEKILKKSQSKSKKALTTNEKVVWNIYQTSKRLYGGQTYWKVFLAPTRGDALRLKNWKGIITDASTDQTKDNIEIYMYVPTTDDIANPKVLCYFARNYLRTTINEMMREMGPVLIWHEEPLEYGGLIPAQRIYTPWAAICAALFNRAAGVGRLSVCPHPRCGAFYHGRMDKGHCGRARCAKWVSRHRSINPN